MQEEMAPPCSHLASLTSLPEPAVHECAECIAMDDTWVHLRMCLQCGHVACCDSSKNKHASAHNHSTEHPVMRSIEPGERWVWCFEDGDTITL